MGNFRKRRAIECIINFWKIRRKDGWFGEILPKLDFSGNLVVIVEVTAGRKKTLSDRAEIKKKKLKFV